MYVDIKSSSHHLIIEEYDADEEEAEDENDDDDDNPNVILHKQKTIPFGCVALRSSEICRSTKLFSVLHNFSGPVTSISLYELG